MLTPLKCKKIRNATGLTQKKFAKLLQVKFGTIAAYEQGSRKPCTSSTLRYIKIAMETGVQLTRKDLDY